MTVVAAIDLNCDIGEELDDAIDSALFPLITSASIACGGHAGSPASMSRSIDRALERGVAIGAHISYPDRTGFGRVTMPLGATGVGILVRDQVSALQHIASRAGAQVSYVKPHGALYHDACADLQLADLIVAELAEVDPGLRVVGMPGSALRSAAGAAFIAEGFPERGYASLGALQSRTLPGAVIEESAEAARRAVAMARGEQFELVDGSVARVAVQTLCIHSDHPNALENARAIRAALDDAGIDVRAFA